MKGFARPAVVVCMSAAIVGFGARPAFAHDSIEEALARGAGPPDWVYQWGARASAVAIIGIGGLGLYRRLRGGAPVTRYGIVLAQLLAGWLLLGFVQAATARTPGTPMWLYLLGEVVFLLAITAVWAFVQGNVGGTVRLVLRRPRYRLLAIALAVVVAGFYLWIGNVIAPPEPDEMPAPGTDAFAAFVPIYGPLAMWPAVEFWLPQITLFGAPSVGTVLVVGTIAALMALSWTAILFAAQLRRHVSRAQNAKLGGLGGLGVAGASFCCCCTPAIYPALALVFGTSTASSISAWLLGSSSPFYNLSMVGMIALMLWALTSISKQIKRAEEASQPADAPVREAPQPVGRS